MVIETAFADTPPEMWGKVDLIGKYRAMLREAVLSLTSVSGRNQKPWEKTPQWRLRDFGSRGQLRNEALRFGRVPDI